MAADHRPPVDLTRVFSKFVKVVAVVRDFYALVADFVDLEEALFGDGEVVAPPTEFAVHEVEVVFGHRGHIHVFLESGDIWLDVLGVQKVINVFLGVLKFGQSSLGLRLFNK